ncbi:hypothetical protein AKO1_008035 [Acrasis kona]|uniref:Inhibitor of growth protein n=1 Tax=Acrasis kona TaxID=1008807 RepID=A0AAW2YQ69_9EUKA
MSNILNAAGQPLFLENYVESLSILPTDMHHNLTLIRDLDKKCATIIENVRKEVATPPAITVAPGVGKKQIKEQQKKHHERVEKQLKEVLETSEEKLVVAIQTYETVDKFIRKLDDEIAKFSDFLQREKDIINNTTSPHVAVATNSTKKKGGAKKSNKSKVRNLVSMSDKEFSLEDQLGEVALAVPNAITDSKNKKKKKNQPRPTSPVSTRSKDIAQQKLASMKHPALSAQAQPSHLHDPQTQPQLEDDMQPPPLVPDVVVQPSLVIKVSHQNGFSSKSQKTPSTPASSGKNKRSFQEMAGNDEKSKNTLPRKRVPKKAPIAVTAQPDMPVHTDEPVYCICQKTSYGEMIACDDYDCPVEWYHFACVGINPETPPNGEWYCPTCAPKHQH